MTLVRLGKKGQLSIPKAILNRLGVEGVQLMLIDTTEDGAIVLRPAGVYPIEIYTDARLSEFLTEDDLRSDERERAYEALAPHGRR